MDEKEITSGKKITVIVPTYNRSACIAYLVKKCYQSYCGNMICVEIHDSSPDDSTQKIFEEANLGDNFKYFHYEPDINGDVKTMQAISKVETPYIYLMGDGVVVDFNALEKWLTEIDFENYSIIGLRENNMPKYSRRYAPEKCITENIREYFNHYFAPLVLYGASIISRHIALEACRAVQKYMVVSPFMYICSVFDSLEKVGGPCYFSYVDFMSFNPNKKASYWVLSHQTIDFFCYQYYLSMGLLPECYQATEPESLKNHNNFSGLFRFKSVLKMRATDNLTWKLYRKYKFYIKKTVPHMSNIYFALCIPAFVMRGAYRIFKWFKNKREKI